MGTIRSLWTIPSSFVRFYTRALHAHTIQTFQDPAPILLCHWTPAPNPYRNVFWIPINSGSGTRSCTVLLCCIFVQRLGLSLFDAMHVHQRRLFYGCCCSVGRKEWFGNGIYRNRAEIMKAVVPSSILNTDMDMFGRTHGKLWRIWDYVHLMEWMINYDGYGASRII